MSTRLFVVIVIFALSCVTDVAVADAQTTEKWSMRGQVTFVEQYHPAFRSTYRGANSLNAGNSGEETFDATLVGRLSLWSGAELYVDPEIDQGFGLSDTRGLAGFPSGEAYKVGKAAPYFRLQRLFLRQIFHFGGAQNGSEAPSGFTGPDEIDTVTITAGKFSPVDLFDTNIYAHDPKADFLNWSIIDGGAYDYAADAWGYSYGIATEWVRHPWILRLGLFNLSRVPNSTALETGFAQFELVGEIEKRYALFSEAGSLKILGFINRGRMGAYDDALRLAGASNTTPDTSLVRNFTSRTGLVFNWQQRITENAGVFARMSYNDGSKEAYEFTEINRSFSAGLSVTGNNWGRPDDKWGAALVVNGLSESARRYFAAGGLGILIGDGQLRHYGPESIIETYYSARLSESFAATLDYQFVSNPAYTKDRGPVSIFATRLHTDF